MFTDCLAGSPDRGVADSRVLVAQFRHALESADYLGRASQSGTCSAITRPISNEAVTAGEGALQICIPHLFLLTIRKSSTTPPSDRSGWARTPDSAGTRSSSQISGINFCRLRVKAFLLKDLYISSRPDRACFLTSRQNPG